ncbi:MAG: transposase [Sedimentisphaerales bacterium]|nr:transposase [Sedimentisphaerales bacterium]
MKNSFFSEKFNNKDNNNQENGKMFFVTFRLADAIADNDINLLQVARQQWLAVHIPPFSEEEQYAFETMFNSRLENWLDMARGGCILRRPECMSILVDKICYYDQDKYQMDHWVITPNHVHALLIPRGDNTVNSIVQEWKLQSANEINSYTGFVGSHLWHYENTTRPVNSESQLQNWRNYIIEDAEKFHGHSYLATQKAIVLI